MTDKIKRPSGALDSPSNKRVKTEGTIWKYLQPRNNSPQVHASQVNTTESTDNLSPPTKLTDSAKSTPLKVGKSHAFTPAKISSTPRTNLGRIQNDHNGTPNRGATSFTSSKNFLNCTTPTRTSTESPTITTPSRTFTNRTTPKGSASIPSTPTTHNNVATNDEESLNHPHLSYKFLKPDKRLDINKRPPSHPDYDEKTLYIPEEFLNSQTPALRQWWLIKQKNMDAILFFKMGKFYELFNEDAVIGVNNLDIMYMKGDESKPAHAGFPEVSYGKYSRMLIDKGYKVIRVEQTETPAMVEERCQTTGRKGKFDKVVQREVCRVTTKGTQMLGIMESIFHTSMNQYLMAIMESHEGLPEDTTPQKNISFGVCFIDVTVGRLYIGQFTDDYNLSKFSILLSHYKPTEVIYERNRLQTLTMQALMGTGAVLTPLKPQKEFWPVKKALSHLKVNHVLEDDKGNFQWPPLILKLFEQGEDSDSPLGLEPKPDYKLGLDCFGAIVYYLSSQMIVSQALNCTIFELYRSPLDKLPQSKEPDMVSYTPMIMDHVVLKNLEILENCSGRTDLTLFKSIDQCKTHFGRRLLRNWLCSPLCDFKQIENRLDAVECLMSNKSASLMNEIVHALGQTPDLERLLSKLKSQCFKSDNDAKAIMFDGDQYSKAKIKSFLNLISNFKRLLKFISSVSKSASQCSSQVLKRLLTLTVDGGLYPDYSATIEFFENAFDHDAAQKTGKIIPAPGVDKEYDNCSHHIMTIKEKLDDYLQEQRDTLRCRHIEYFGSAKNRYQIQVPEAYCHKVPDEYRIETTRKGFKRYYTPTIDKLFAKLTTYEEDMKKTLDGIMSRIFEQFSRKIKLWSAAIECMALLDVLQSIAQFARSLQANDIPVCRPQFITSGPPSLSYKDGRHPALVKIDPNFTPNDLNLDEKLLLLSGANMGGKSTLMRQTALLVVLAQIGCFVPASEMRLTPVDRIFSRLGASDSILEGESTFYKELVETSTVLRCSSRNSLILLDELGRGTSTYDGTAIAYSVLKEISNNIRCRCIFSTHYHTLTRDIDGTGNIRLAHMACKIETCSTDTVNLDPLQENITFLYKIADGPVARSYGFNVAKLAGINDDIIREAFSKAQEMEKACKALESMQIICKQTSNIDRDDLKTKVIQSLIC